MKEIMQQDEQKMNGLSSKIKIFADGAELEAVPEMIKKYGVRGFTTNPTLMAKAGVKDYAAFARHMLAVVKDHPVSFEVFADDGEEMGRQARILSSWGKNVYVKIPITNTEGVSTAALIKQLSREGIKINTTAVLTRSQVDSLEDCFVSSTPAIVSLFAGRIADAGYDPRAELSYALEKLSPYRNVEVLWASTREVYNLVEAVAVGCHIITMPPDIIRKAHANVGKDLSKFSLETVKMFREDADKSGYSV